MDKKNLAFDRVNYLLLAVGMAIVIIGFLLMSGSGSTVEAYNADIFSTRRITVAPITCLFGFVFMAYGVMHKPKDTEASAHETMEGDRQ